ncbi:MAG: electron transporter RnfG [Bacteroidetes bacterium]|nr:MAG: electron transporter RnfG [Bacteroidota bacterium]
MPTRQYYFKLGFILLLITAIASGILAFVNNFTKPIIEENQRKAKALARKEVLSSAIIFEEVTGGFPYFIGKNKDNEITGYTFIATKYGYSSNVKTMVGVNPDFSIAKIRIIEQSETPGLGANSVKLSFQDQFSHKMKTDLKVNKDGGEIIALTGATITSRAVTNSIREGLDKLMKSVKELHEKKEKSEK